MGEDLRGSGEDRISGLPDDLLHVILVRLRSARAAARTSVLSRRWRHLWCHLPELYLDGDRDAPPAAASFLDIVDAALACYSAPALESLSVSLSRDPDLRVRAGRVAPWLRFAAEHVAGKLVLDLPKRWVSLLERGPEDDAVLELPACERAKTIALFLGHVWRLRLQPAGLFAALTSLTIFWGRMEVCELTALVCTQCPRLKNLKLSLELVAISDVSVRSDSLHSLWFFVRNTQRLEVLAPRLKRIAVRHAMEARISAPKLAKIDWSGDAYDPHHHQFVVVGRRLRELTVSKDSVVSSLQLVQQLDEVDELGLQIHIPEGIAGYESFLLNETNEVPKCKNFRISVLSDHIGLAPGMLHLLRSCNDTKKLSVVVPNPRYPTMMHSCPMSCPCRLKESCKIDGAALSSLEEVEICGFTDSHENVEFVELLLSCNAPILKQLAINYTISTDPPVNKDACEKIRSMCYPNVKVEFSVFSDKGRVRFD